MRKVFFWIHLVAGVSAGAVIFIMSVTGVLLTYERQMTAWADRAYRSAQAPPESKRLPVEALLEASIRESRNGVPASLTIHSDPSAAAEASFGRERTLYIDVYSGAVLGEGSRAIRTFFRIVTDWHRWLGAQGESRPTGRAITGACNLAFLFLVMSGFYLWLPRRLGSQHVRAVMLFRGGLKGKARDFNWHNVIGFWSAVPLFFIVLGGVVISYPWATNLLYKMTGSEQPPPTAPAQRREQPGRQVPGSIDVSGFNEAWSRAESQVPEWRTISLRIPASSSAPLDFSIDQAHRGRPDKRSQLTIDRETTKVLRLETFGDYNTGRRIRTWLRWIHTGEAGGIAGQTVAGIVSAGATVLVWTGLALSWRRFSAWRARTRSREMVEV